ncbi:MAG: lipocalin-like domain-containing protein, partial [Chloroflexota bacterium]
MRAGVKAALALLPIAVLLAACAGNAGTRPVPTPASPAPTPTPRPVSLPGDEAPHDDRLEWWYYNGHLEAEDGRELGFHFVIFQRMRQEAERQVPSYTAHATLMDMETGRHLAAAKASSAVQPQPDDGLSLDVDGWSLEGRPDGHRIEARSEDFSLLLELVPQKPVALHNESGWLGGSFTGWTYYYSWTRMRTNGEVTLEGETYEVTGQSWMDHQWGDFFVFGKPGGWQWLAIQLEDGTDIMVTETRNTAGEVDALFGTLVEPDGTARPLRPGEGLIELEETGSWRSPHTGALYPQAWRVRLPEHGLD